MRFPGGWDGAFWALTGVGMLQALAGYFAVNGRIVCVEGGTLAAGEAQRAGVAS